MELSLKELSMTLASKTIQNRLSMYITIIVEDLFTNIEVLLWSEVILEGKNVTLFLLKKSVTLLYLVEISLDSSNPHML